MLLSMRFECIQDVTTFCILNMEARCCSQQLGCMSGLLLRSHPECLGEKKGGGGIPTLHFKCVGWVEGRALLLSVLCVGPA